MALHICSAICGGKLLLIILFAVSFAIILPHDIVASLYCNHSICNLLSFIFIISSKVNGGSLPSSASKSIAFSDRYSWECHLLSEISFPGEKWRKKIHACVRITYKLYTNIAIIIEITVFPRGENTTTKMLWRPLGNRTSDRPFPSLSVCGSHGTDAIGHFYK